MLNIRLLGGFDLTLIAGATLGRPGRKLRGLLAYLAMSRGVAVPRGRLAGLLWGERDEEQARHSLSQALTTLRATLGPAAALLRACPEGVHLGREGLEVDVDAFEAAVRSPQQAALQEACGLYRGAFLEGLEIREAGFEEWQLSERYRLGDLAADAFARLLDLQIAAGDAEAAIATGRRLVAIAPFDEPAHARLIQLYGILGRRGLAEAHYARSVDLLRRELGQGPGEELRAALADARRRPPGISVREKGNAMSPARLDPQGPFMRDPPAPHRMRDRLTRTQDVMVLCHLGVPRLEPDQWSLAIDGMVERARTLRFDELMRYPKAEVVSIHECCGSPFAPFEPKRRVCNVRWGGARLADVLADCRPSANARYLWSYGADSGVFSGVAVDAFVKDLPIARVEADVLVAYELNGSALPAEHGFPARLVVPGFYGTNSVKWLTRITLAERRAPGPFTTGWYNDPVLDGAGRETGEATPVWSIAPESLIVSPMPHETVALAAEREIWGWAWADGGVQSVQVRTDDAATWRAAELEPPRGRAWQRFSLPWTPSQRGVVVLASRADAVSGLVQPRSGRRNATYDVAVNVA